MINNYHSSLSFASISGKKVKADFTGGVLTSDAGVLFLREIEKRMGIIKRLASVLVDRRHQSYIDSYEELLSQRIYQIICGYEDANDCNDLRTDPAIKFACDRLPITGADLASQPTMTRLENSVSRTDLYRIGRALVDVFLDSYSKPPKEIVLDVDDTNNPIHGQQQMRLFNAYYDQYCFQPFHIYEGRSGKLITTILRPGKRPNGTETRSMLTHLVSHIRERWPEVVIFLRGDSHFSTPELHEWAEANDVLFALGQSANPVLKEKAADLLQGTRELYESAGRKIRLFGEFEYQAESWDVPRRFIYVRRKSHPRVIIFGSSQSIFKAFAPLLSIVPSTAPEAGWRISSKTIRTFCIRTVHHVTASKPISSGSFFIAPRTCFFMLWPRKA